MRKTEAIPPLERESVAASVGALIDLTEIRRQETELQENRAALSLAQRHAGFGHYVLNSRTGNLAFVSQSLIELMGLNRDEVIGHNSVFFRNMILEEDRERVLDVYVTHLFRSLGDESLRVYQVTSLLEWIATRDDAFQLLSQPDTE